MNINKIQSNDRNETINEFINSKLAGIELYYDGVEIEKNNQDFIKGFTTNISFMKDAGISDYDKFIKKSLEHTNDRPISFQLYDNVDETIEITARKIQSYNKNIFVKIPVIKLNGDYNNNIIKKLHNDHNIQINVTAIFTKEQIDAIKDCFNKDINVIISVFGGRINDCSNDCSDVVKYAVETFKDYKNIKILWAACRTIYNIFEAKTQGAHIVTVPNTVLKRLYRINQTPDFASLETVNTFYKDGIDGNIHF
jgi:transaldolase